MVNSMLANSSTAYMGAKIQVQKIRCKMEYWCEHTLIADSGAFPAQNTSPVIFHSATSPQQLPPPPHTPTQPFDGAWTELFI
jgi:hypothetical protein